MANLPANNDMTGAAVTQGGFKARLNDVLDFLRDILGSTGTPASARSALGLGALAVKSDVAAADIATGAVTAAKIADGAVTEAKIGSGAVTAAKIADAAVGTAKVADNAVTAAKVAADAVTAPKIATGAVTAAKIADGAVTAAKIGAGAVGTTQIADGGVTAPKLASGTLSVRVLAAADIASPVAQVDLDLPSGPAMFWLIVGDLRPSAASQLLLRTSSDGVTFQSGGSDYTNVDGNEPVPWGAIRLANAIAASENAAPVLHATLFPGAAATSRFSVHASLGCLDIGSSQAAIFTTSGARAAAGRQMAIRLFMSTGNINRATIRLIGVY